MIDADNVSMTPTCVTTEQTTNTRELDIPTWVLMLPPDMAAMATVAWFYGSLPEMDMAA